MNKSRIEWCDHTWNPVTGCLHNCEYCYARKMTARFSGDIRLNKMAKNDYEILLSEDCNELYILHEAMMNETGKQLIYPFGFEPTVHKYRFDNLDSLKMGNNIFVCSMADLFGKWVPDEWIGEVIGECVKRPQHNYLFLTKNVERYTQYGVPAGFENMWYGTSITKESEMSRFNHLPAQCKTFISMEPILDDLNPEHHNILFQQVDWIILGAETGNRKNKVIPKWDWIKRIVLQADNAGIPVFMKDSLIPIVTEENMRRDFPVQLKQKQISKKMMNKLYGNCCLCKIEFKKSEMIALCARSMRGEQPKQYGFMCKRCFKDFCEKNNIKTPKLKKMEE